MRDMRTSLGSESIFMISPHPSSDYCAGVGRSPGEKVLHAETSHLIHPFYTVWGFFYVYDFLCG